MIILVGGAFGLGKTTAVFSPESSLQSEAYKILQPETHEWLKQMHFHTHHPDWISFTWGEGATFYQPATPFSWWDMIQPAFMLMAGVSIPFALKSRTRKGQTNGRILGHAAWRSFVLVGLGVFLYSVKYNRTHFDFMNVLAQIGLGYFFVYLIALIPGKKYLALGLASIGILCSYSLIMHQMVPVEPSVDGIAEDVDPIQIDVYKRDANAGTRFDRWLLNLFPRPTELGPYQQNNGGYQTLNFLPSMVTMLFGVVCGWILLDTPGKGRMVSGIFLLGVLLLALSIPVESLDGPMIKKIWTSSWTLFSGGVVVVILGLLVVLFDLMPLEKVGGPIAVIGMNSLAIYMMSQLFGGWLREQIATHLGWIAIALGLNEGNWVYYQYVAQYCIALAILWWICFYMHRKQIYLRP